MISLVVTGQLVSSSTEDTILPSTRVYEACHIPRGGHLLFLPVAISLENNHSHVQSYCIARSPSSQEPLICAQFQLSNG